MSVTAKETLRRHPDWPAKYPFETPFHVGFVGALFTPEKSIFLFDPLLLLMILLAVIAWRRFSSVVRAYVITLFVLLLAYICFYARYTVWSGDSAWGDRYVSTTAELAAFLAVPLLLRHRSDFGRLVWTIGIFLAVASAVVQVSSVAFWLSLEVYQVKLFARPTFVVGLRLENIAAFALNKVNAWGLATHVETEDAWDYAHITTWNFLPFLLRRMGQAPGWAVNIAFAVWGAGLVALTATAIRLRQVLRRAR